MSCFIYESVRRTNEEKHVREWLKWQKVLWMAFLIGKVPPLTNDTVKKMRELWVKLNKKEREHEHADLRESSQQRRASMSENAQRGSFTLAAVALVITIVAVIVPKANGMARLLALCGAGCLLFGVILVLWINVIKWKLFGYRKKRRPEALKRLERAVDRKSQGGLACFEDYRRSADNRESRDILSYVDRWALLVATVFYIIGIILAATALFMSRDML